jgi:hypothetical protein
MGKTKALSPTGNLIWQRRQEIEKLVSEHEAKAAFYRNELEAIDEVLARINKDPLSAQQGSTRRELAYQYLKKNGKGYFSDILRHVHPTGLDPKKAQGIRSGFGAALDALVKTKAIKKVKPKDGKRGILYVFNK